jgi:hypothetical protein
MKLARLVCAVIALPLVAGLATVSSACDDSKSTGVKASAATAPAASPAGSPAGSKKSKATVASASGTTCSAAMAAKCTPEMAAACKASMAAGGPDLCTGQKASATAAVVAANNGDACCMGGKATAVAASSHGSCAAKGAKTSASAGGTCNGHGMATMAATSSHTDCDACADMADCSGALDAAGAHRQTVRLKNGIMWVYTADSPRNVSAVQAAVARRVDRMARLATAGDKAHLCDECKAMRGAMASGKLSREVINIEGGSLTLVTSSDPTVVAKLHAMADEKVATRVKL